MAKPTCYCNQPELLDALCDKHFIEQKITPLMKERDNSQNIVDALNKQIHENLDRLNFSREHKLTEKDLYKTSPRPAKPKFYCHTCNQAYENYFELSMHEEDCKKISKSGHKVRVNSRKQSSPASKSPVTAVDDMDYME